MKRLTVAELGTIKPKYANFAIEYCKDFNVGRAACASGFSPGTGSQLLNREDVQAAIQSILNDRLQVSHIDAEWALMEAVDNHLLARQLGNIPASNAALRMIMQHAAVDAFAAEKVEVASDEAVRERLLRARKRFAQQRQPDTGAEPPAEPEDGEPSFL